MLLPLTALGLPSDALLWQALFLTTVSFGVGVLGGFVGLALGTMRLPFLLLLGFPAPVAAGTNVIVSTVSAITGAYRHLRDGRVDGRVVLIMGLPSAVGAFVGGFLGGRVPEALLIAVAGVLVVWQAVELLARARGQKPAPNSAAPSRAGALAMSGGRIATEGAIGLGIGLLGGAVGLILGSLRLPALLHILRMDPRVAVGTNLVIGFLMGAFAFVGHGLQGQADVPLLVAMGVTGMAGTYIGARQTGRASVKTLLLAIGWVLLAVGLVLLGDAYGRWRA
ncbi:MAG: sulfite exporter TauE/SafE family protein [Chloroflexi bacterium]|nr:sulfite exporter TauE/SafE family protein [Chloroflexota bacterium]